MTEGPVLLVPPELGFAALRAKLEDAGWLLGAESQEAPLVAGEPHWCEWWHRAGDATIHYTFNPVVNLRVLAFAGSHAAVARAAVGDVVPSLDDAAVAALIDGADERSVLLGLLAAGAARNAAVLAQVKARLTDERPRVAAAAAEAAAEIAPPVVVQAAEQLARAQRSRPDRSAVFAAAGPPEHKRQILRWLAHDFDGSSTAIDQVLRAALVDPDPEVRITAVVVAARLGAAAVVPALIAAELPETTSDGADPRERRLYHLVRQVAVEYLNAVARGGPSGNRTTWPIAVRGLLGDLPIADDMTLLVHALATPVPRDEDPAPPPGGIVRDGVRWRLAATGAELARIAAVPHWLGHGGNPTTPPNRLRSITPATFFMLAEPWTDGDARWRGTLGEAEAIAATLARTAGIAARVPTADEWELALRGPDGRLYPWGSNLAATARGGRSPWRAAPPRSCEWTVDDRGAAVVVGGDAPVPCAFRRTPLPDDRCGVRFVIG